MPLQWSRQQEASAFLARAGPWLLESEAEYNLILGIARRLLSERMAIRPYLAVLEDDGRVCGGAMRTVPHKLLLTRIPGDGLEPLIADVGRVFADLPAVLGPETVVQRFGALWADAKGVVATPGMRQRIYELKRVDLPGPWPSGALRTARAEDVALVARWVRCFTDEAGAFTVDARREAERMVDDGSVVLWDDGEPVSMAARSGQTPHGARIGWVYTPPERRGSGYATACVAAFSERLLRSGLRRCFLYTDLSNPTSNRIYSRIGYRTVCDVLDVNFTGAPQPHSTT